MTQYVINIGALPNDGTGDPLRTAFNDVNLNFNQVWATGLVGSNIAIANNTILTTNTNGNLILNPNGIGNVIANAHILPDQTRVRNLGSSTRLWDTVYAQYVNVGGTLTVTGDLSVNGNLSVTGNIIEVGNIITDAKTIQLANTAGTANAANGSGITVGANDNIATFLYNSADNAWVTNVRFETGNLILTDDRIMDLYGPSITNADLISGSTSGLDIVPNGDANATVLYNTYGNILLQTSNTGSNVKVFTFRYDGTLLAPSAISAVGNITGNYFIGNGSQLTGISSSGNSITNGTSNVQIANPNGNVLINSSGPYTWNFDTTGNLTVPANSWINSPAGTSSNIQLHPDGYGTVKIAGNSSILLNLYSDEPNKLNRIQIDTFGNQGNLGGTFTGTFSRGNVFGSHTAVLANDQLAGMRGRGYDGNILALPTGLISIDAADNWSPGYTPTRINFWTTDGAGTANINMQINPNGNVYVYNGNLIVTGGGGYLQGNTETGNGGIYSGIAGFTPLGSDVVAQFAGNVNSYSQVNFQNISSGNIASTDYIATADNGDDSNYYVDLGINSSTFDDPTDYPGFFPNDAYVHNHGGNLIINPETAGKVIKLMVGGTATENIVATVLSSGFNVTGNITVTLASITTPTAYANLTAVAGARAFINNGNLVAAGNFGAQVIGGGANTVPVWSDGVNWYIG